VGFLWFSFIAGCQSHADNVCEGVTDCERGGDSEWLAACQDEAKQLSKESSSLGCGGQFDSYYACADDNFQCNGATASFPGCDDQRAALETCLTLAQGSTACSELTARTATCTAVDAGAAGAPDPTCTLARDCAARCYLDTVSNVCAPNAAELSAVGDCTQSCRP
jgi:hypothetical protein